MTNAPEVPLVGAHAQFVCQVLRTHHEAEDLVRCPLLVERAEAEATEIVAVVGEAHHAIAAASPLTEKYVTVAEWVQMPIWRMQ
jgi:hypothetical protein